VTHTVRAGVGQVRAARELSSDAQVRACAIAVTGVMDGSGVARVRRMTDMARAVAYVRVSEMVVHADMRAVVRAAMTVAMPAAAMRETHHGLREQADRPDPE